MGNSTTTSYGYDAQGTLGSLRQTTVNGTSTQLLYDGERLVAEYDAAGVLVRRYVHGPGVDEPVVGYEGSGTGNKQWYYADHLGSVIGSANAAGSSTAIYRHGPFGELEPGTPPARFGYTGQQYLGALELYHYKARMYSPWLGRFLQTDPIGYDGGMNLYAYVGNNPLNFVDPSGLIVADALRLVAGITETVVTGGFATQMSQAYAAGNYGEAAVNFVAAAVYGAVNVAMTVSGANLAVAGLGVVAKGIASFPKNPGQLRHIFRNAPGHLADTPANRQLLSDVASNSANRIGVDRFGNVWSTSTRSDGTQVWVSTRNGVIQNGGVNQVPRDFPNIVGP